MGQRNYKTNIIYHHSCTLLLPQLMKTKLLNTPISSHVGRYTVTNYWIHAGIIVKLVLNYNYSFKNNLLIEITLMVNI